MTPEQFDRWKDFAVRAAKTWFRRSRRPDTKWIVAAVEDFFDSLPEEDVICLRSWDRSDDYPEGHKHRRLVRDYHCECRYRDGKLLPYAKPDCPLCHGRGSLSEWENPYSTGDTYDEWETDYIHYDCEIVTRHESDRLDSLRRQDRYDEAYSLREAITERYSSPVQSCIRAGMDVASEPSAGVLGYTAGHIRMMYPEGVPDWLARLWDDAEEVSQAAVVPGIGFIPKVVGPGRRFEEMADTAGVWL